MAEVVLSTYEGDVLAEIGAHTHTAPAELAGRTRSTPSELAKALKKLADAGFVSDPQNGLVQLTSIGYWALVQLPYSKWERVQPPPLTMPQRIFRFVITVVLPILAVGLSVFLVPYYRLSRVEGVLVAMGVGLAAGVGGGLALSFYVNLVIRFERRIAPRVRIVTAEKSGEPAAPTAAVNFDRALDEALERLRSAKPNP
jgi:hypothetical protein